MERVYDFLRELRENNHRSWFQENKKRYLEAKGIYERFVQEVIQGITLFDAEIEGVQVKDCVFRIYRDVRFSTDKRPYKMHMGAFIVRGGRMNPRGGYYVHVEPGGSLLAGGIWCPGPKLLRALRQDIYDNIEEFTSILREETFARHYRLDGECLKRVPTGFPLDFPEADLLKYKMYTAANLVEDTFFSQEGAVARTVERLKLLHPFNRFLNYTVDESLSFARE